MKLLIKGGTVIDPADKTEEKIDILVESGKISKTGKSIKADGAAIIDALGLFVMPGFVDMHVHFREPGHEYKETIESGSRAAVKGGFTTVCCMPNTDPPIDNQAMVEFINMKAKEVGLIDVLAIGAITKGRQGKELSPMGELYSAGAVAVSDDGSSVMNAEILRRAMEYSSMFDMPVIEHCEDPDLSGDGVVNEGYISTLLGLPGDPKAAEEVIAARDIILAKEFGGRLHLAHISTAGSVELIKWGKKAGANVTAEVTPHHFSLDESCLENYGTNYKMKPPLRGADDVKAVKKALKDNTIQVIATDHAPHAELDKDVEFARGSNGIVGLETAFSLMITNLVDEKVLSLSEAVAKITVNPAKVMNLKGGTLSKGADADIAIADINREFEVTDSFFGGRSTNSPFIGKKLKGRVTHTIKKGKIVHGDKK